MGGVFGAGRSAWRGRGVGGGLESQQDQGQYVRSMENYAETSAQGRQTFGAR